MATGKDHWTSEAYTSSASFVPLLTSKVLQLLSPRPTDHILDLGCGDGVLTSQVTAAVPAGLILALDASLSMIQTASTSHSAPNVTYRVHDCSDLASALKEHVGSFDTVFSNAALHWILRRPEARECVFRDAFTALKPGGRLVFEMGGKGNVAEIHAATVAALMAQGLTADVARESMPWFFPSETWTRNMLQSVGFEVDIIESEYRPTRLNPASGEKGGIRGWVRLMCANALEALPADGQDRAVGFIVGALQGAITREEDGSQWIGYVRQRVVAIKPEA